MNPFQSPVQDRHAGRAGRRLLIVDAQTLFRCGLAALLAASGRFEVAGQAGSVGEAIGQAAELQPDLILHDMAFPDGAVAHAVERLKLASPRSRLLVLTASEDERDLATALKAGVHGYLLKAMDLDALERQLERALQGVCVVSPAMTDLLAQVLHRALRDDGPPIEPPSVDAVGCLSQREREVLLALARGSTNKRIALLLGIAENTVKIHMQNIRRKLGVQSRIEAAMVLAHRPAPQDAVA